MPTPFCEFTFEGDQVLTVPSKDARVVQRVNAHDTLVAAVEYFSPLRRFDEGTPISMRWGFTPGKLMSFYGYIHHTEPVVVPKTDQSYQQKNRVVCLGASYAMKEALLSSWEGFSTTGIVRWLTNRYMFSSELQESNDLVDSVLAGGRTAWKVLVDLAESLGWIVYSNKTKVIFKEPLGSLDELRASAVVLHTVPKNEPMSVLNNDIYSFTVVDGELAQEGGIKADRTLLGLDPRTLQTFQVTDDTSSFVNSQLGRWSTPPLFQRYVSGSSVGVAEAQSTLDAVQQNNRWHIQAVAEVGGNARIHQGQLVYLDGIPQRERGYWFVEEADHQIKNQEYRLYLRLGRDSRFAGKGTPPPPPARRVIHPAGDADRALHDRRPRSRLVNGVWRAEFAGERVVARAP